MEVNQDFEDLLRLFAASKTRYLIIGGMAFIFHAKPRYTKDLDIWVDPDETNIARANAALKDFGSPHALDPSKKSEVLQLGVEPNRIDILLEVTGLDFKKAWPTHDVGLYGGVDAHWIDLDNLILLKSQIAHPRHEEDVRVLRMIKSLHEQA